MSGERTPEQWAAHWADKEARENWYGPCTSPACHLPHEGDR